MEKLTIKRTHGNDPDFLLLVSQLDHELWNELKEDQATYDQYNKVPDIKTVILLYLDEQPAACGCFKQYNVDTVEIKRMFVTKQYRGKGLSKIVLDELEQWAVMSGFRYAILETSVHFQVARTLYGNAGYAIIENYDQYKGLVESVCMKKDLHGGPTQNRDNETGEEKEPVSRPQGPGRPEYFDFESDFVEKNIQCIPMIVRFKLDRAGIKLKLDEWARLQVDERKDLATMACTSAGEVDKYRQRLARLVKDRTGHEASALKIELNPGWKNVDSVPPQVIDKAAAIGAAISPEQWKGLTALQRFALLKLTSQGHESRNFAKAVKEFGLMGSIREVQ